MKKLNIVAAICAVLFSFVYLQCKNSKPTDPRGSMYAGSKSCIKCHSNIYSSYLHTAHYIAAIPANDNNVHGNFTKDSNVFEFSPTQKIVMEKIDGGMFQTYYVNGKIKESHRFDIVLGGIKGESYLYWNGNGLNQLPISYYSEQHKWVLSPRFDPRFVNFNRTITSRCLECHASYAGDQPDEPQRINAAEQFDKTSLVYSVDCERCHGPAAQHVDFQTNNPTIKTARFITSINLLPRMRKLDLCGSCHSGNKSEMLRSTFWFKPGDTLATFKLPGIENTANSGHLDVHGNQLQLLESSKCFINSKMECTTCHDVHQNETNNIALFTQKCLNCHNEVTHNYCKMANTSNAKLIRSNCIQCHMPALPSAVIMSPNMNKTLSADIFINTHHIAIYPDEAKKIVAMANKL